MYYIITDFYVLKKPIKDSEALSYMKFFGKAMIGINSTP